MPRAPERRNSDQPLPTLVDPNIMRALSHVVRQHILLAATQGPISPTSVSERLGVGISHASYHCRVLLEQYGGLIELDRVEKENGAVEQFFKASDKTLIPARSWRSIKTGMRAIIGAGMASDLFDDLAASLAAGKLESPQSYIFRTPLILDAAGGRTIKEIAERAAAEVEEQQQASAKRIADGKPDGALGAFSFGVLAFESANASPDTHPLADQVAP